MQNLRILIIDDNPSIHQDFLKILSSKNKNNESDVLKDLESQIFDTPQIQTQDNTLPNFEIDTALQGREGVEKIIAAIKENKPFALVFVDIRMPPGWDGVETIKHIWEVDGNIQVVICTAYSDYTWEETVEKLGQTDNLLILKKPFDNMAVRQLACALTKKWQLSHDSRQHTVNLESKIQERTESLENSISLIRATLNSSADGILVVDTNGTIKDYNQKLLQLFPESAEALRVNSFASFLNWLTANVETDCNFLDEVNDVVEQTKITGFISLNLANGTIFECYYQPYSINELIIGRVWCFRDITKRASLENKLQHQATHDYLTGLPNRLMLTEKLRDALDTAQSTGLKFAIIFLDLDRFKLINDSLSHEAGDMVLCAVAKRLETIIQDSDCLARIGGDEFVILTENIEENTSLVILADSIRNLFNQPFHINKHDFVLSTSIGISVYPDHGNKIDILLRNADSAMYHAKSFGTNQYQFYTEDLNIKNLNRLEKESELRKALINNQFVIYYQPQIEISTERMVSVEALVRWNHPTKGLLLPIDFIPLAEETNLIIEIGEWVLRNACLQIKNWIDAGLDPIRVAVNVSLKQSRLYNLDTIVQSILKETGLDPCYLELELTENVIINSTQVIRTLENLKKLGVQIALDDFGTGYAGLNYLRGIPIDKLKIDQSFIKNADNKRGDDVIVQAIISMAKSLDLEVIAEGVETVSQLNYLKKLDCKEVQGFYYSKPLTPEQCENYLMVKKQELLTVD